MPRPIKSGSYRQRVTLYDVPESNTDTWGQPSQEPTSIGTFWAEVRPLKGDEMLNVRQVWPTATHKVKMRWLASSLPATSDNPQRQLMPQMKFQLVLDKSWLNIIWADNVEKRNWQWELICEEHVGASA
jgi:head-tail adaptor